jgi:putative Mg2+ transporter-C (MgtC) family protein
VYLSEIEGVIRLGVAVVMGGLIGFERETADKPAGLRTYILVCVGATLFMICSLLLGDLVFATTGDIYDPSRIASTIVQGIGFLAAGVIFASGREIRGLTTAAGIWVTAAIGMAIGAGFYIVAAATTIIALVTLRLLAWIEVRGAREAAGEQTDKH